MKKRKMKKLAAALLALCMVWAPITSAMAVDGDEEPEANTAELVVELESEPEEDEPEAATAEEFDGEEPEAEAPELEEPRADIAFRVAAGGLQGAKMAYSVDGAALVELDADSVVEIERGELRFNNVLIFIGPADGCVLTTLPAGTWDQLPNNSYSNYVEAKKAAIAEGYQRVGRMTAQNGMAFEMTLDAAGAELDFGNTPITWLRSEDLMIKNKLSPLFFNYASKSIDWKWSDMEALGLTADHEDVWNSNAAYDSARLGDVGGNRNLTRLTGSFTIPEGYSTKDYAQLFSINRNSYADGDNNGDLIGVNDDFFVFVYAAEDAGGINDGNFMDYLAFWSGVDNQRQTIPFNGYMGTPVRRYVGGNSGSPWVTSDAKMAKAFSLSDGWAVDATIDNIGGTLFKCYPAVDEATEFVIDVFFFNTTGSGAMDRLAMNFTPASDYTATVRYWQDAVGAGNGGTLLTTTALKDLTYKQNITLTAGELGYADHLLPNSGGYYPGRQVQNPYTIWADGNVIDVVYTARPQDPAVVEYDLSYAWTGEIPEGYQVPAGGKYADGAEISVDGTFTAETVVQGDLGGETGIYTFSGWDLSALSEGKMPAGDARLTGVWSFTPTAKHTVTFYVDNEQYGETQVVLDGQDAADPGYTAPEGYTFSGWDKSFTNVTTDLDVYGTTAPVEVDPPVGPVEPVDPPEEPDQPTEPEIPSNPDEPEVPGNPDEPEVPGNPDQPSKPGKPSKPGTPNLPERPEIDLPEEDIPLADLPIEGEMDLGGPEVPLAGLPELPAEEAQDSGETVIIVDESAPLGDLPQTGTAAARVTPAATLGVVALILAMALSGVTVVSVRKEEDAE